MNCHACGVANRDGVSFCESCGARMAAACAACGAVLAAGARFCGSCGQAAEGAAAPAVAPTAAQMPAAFAAGRYQVQRFLGEGAKKRVYLARDARLDRDVAFALIKTEGLDADGLVRVRREAQAMGRLGDHPHIVTIHDTGDEHGAPFIVSQFRAGGSVEDLLAKAEGHRIASERAMRIGEQVCHALQHAHERGIVHRDLKPGNVWLDDEGNAALGDFGLAVVLDHSRMTMAGMMVGTVAYMAPEQALGRTPDVRSDLYALGAMLYEMVCGRPPFLGDDAVGVISQHINTPPVAPSWHNPETPKPLEAVILRLLAKLPEERPASAQEVARELRRVLERSTVEPPPAAPAGGAPDLRALNWGWFVGRREEMDALKDALEGALSGKGGLAMLVGEPGIGKTRLAEEFGVYAGLRGAQVLTGHCYEGETSLPYRPFIEAFRQYTRSHPDAELRRQMGAGAPEIATLVSEIRQRFPDVELAAPLDPEAERLRLFESVTDFLHNASAANPIVLHLDDLHWSDKPSLLLLQHLAQRLARDRVLVLGAYRDVELDRTHPLSETLGALRRLPNYRRVLLRGLPHETIVDLLAVIDPSDEGAGGRQALAAALHQETEGNPFFIREVLAHLIETGKIVHENGRWVGRVTSVSELGIPEGVREVIGRRLSQLSDACNRMLTRASTMTGGFSWESLKAINGDAGEEALLDLLEEALSKQMIAERKGELADTYDFTHALIRQTLYGELSGPRRVLLHRQIGEALEALYAGSIDAHLPELAHHFYQAAPGGDVEKAIGYARRAGDRAMAAVAWEEAIANYDRAMQVCELRAEPHDGAWFDLAQARANAQAEVADYEGCAATARLALEHARDPELRARLAYWLAWGLFGMDPIDVHRDAPRALEDAIAQLPPGDSEVKSRALSMLGVILQFTQQFGRRVAAAEESLAIARRLGDDALLAEAIFAAHSALWDPAHIARRLELAAEGIGVAQRAGDQSMLSRAYIAKLTDTFEIGSLDEHAATLPLARAAAERARHPWAAWMVRIAEAALPLKDGRFDEADRRIADALAFGQASVGGQSSVVVWGGQIGDLRHLQGRLAEFEPIARASVAQYPDLPVYRVLLAFTLSELDQLDEAVAILRELAQDGFASIARNSTYLIAVYLAAEVCAIVRDQAIAARLYELMLPYADLNVTSANAVCVGSAQRTLGMMAAVLGRLDDAERHFEAAVAFDRRIEAPPWIAHSLYNYARMLIERDAPGDRARALTMLQEALSIAQDLGMAKIIERGLALKLQAQGVVKANAYTSIDAVARAVERERPQISVHPAPDGTVTLMFSDIEDSTVMTERLGDQAWQALLREHNTLIREQLRAHEGFEVKTMGDGFMVAFQSARKALACAVAIQRAFAAHNAAAGEHVRVRVGMHAGEAVRENDDFYGKNVILASRIAGQAKGGEILVSALLRQLVDSSVDGTMFGAARPMELKGLSGTHLVHEVRWAAEGAAEGP